MSLEQRNCERPSEIPYNPTLLVLKLSPENIKPILGAGPEENQTLNFNIIANLLNQAKSNEIKMVSISGGEPFLLKNDLLPNTIRKVFSEGLIPTVETNGFWGKTEDQTKKTLVEMERIGAFYDNVLNISLSIDKHHQEFIPEKSIANIISQFKLGNFPHLKFNIQKFKEDESYQIIDKIDEIFKKKDIVLLETNDRKNFYPARKNEFLTFEKNSVVILEKIGLPSNSSKNKMEELIKKSENKVISWITDIGDGDKKYIIFPEEKHLMPIKFETSFDLLVIAPTGQAYRDLASRKGGIEVRDTTSLSETIRNITAIERLKYLAGKP